jgi:heptosyltransferase-2
VSYRKILVRATNWLGDAVMSVPALRALQESYPDAEISVLAKPSVADLYRRESSCHRLIPYSAKTLSEKWSAGIALGREKFDCAILFQNAFEAAALAFAASIPERIGYARDGRSVLLTRAIPVPRPGEIPSHERFYYLEMLHRAGILSALPVCERIRLQDADEARASGQARFKEIGLGDAVIGVSPGAAYGSAKRWLPEYFAESVQQVARSLGASVALFGSAGERSLCASVASQIDALDLEVHNLAGETTLAEFIDLTAACRVFLTNDSGGMHVASALGVPTVAVFGPTNEVNTGPTGPFARVMRERVHCAPCLKRECPIDHRCMARLSPDKVARAALELVK